MSESKRKKFTSKLKASVAMEAIRETKKGVWSKSVNEVDAEQQWLDESIYQGKSGVFTYTDITALERYSVREIQAN